MDVNENEEYGVRGVFLVVMGLFCIVIVSLLIFVVV